jgi:hypothetical protein
MAAAAAAAGAANKFCTNEQRKNASGIVVHLHQVSMSQYLNGNKCFEMANAHRRMRAHRALALRACTCTQQLSVEAQQLSGCGGWGGRRTIRPIG